MYFTIKYDLFIAIKFLYISKALYFLNFFSIALFQVSAGTSEHMWTSAKAIDSIFEKMNEKYSAIKNISIIVK